MTLLVKITANGSLWKNLSLQSKYTLYVNSAICVWFLYKISIQFIIGSNRHQTNFSIPDERVGNIYPARLMLLFKMVALLLQKKQAFCLLVNLKTKISNSIPAGHQGSVQQRFHFFPVGQNESLVIGSSTILRISFRAFHRGCSIFPCQEVRERSD